MPIDIPLAHIVTKVLDYIENNDVSKGLIILVDMGSLKDIDEQFKQHINGPVAIINNVSTQMALYVGNMLEKDLFLDEIIEKLKEENQIESKLIYPKREKEKIIISSCQTGMGTALQIQKLLESSIPNDIPVKVMAHDYNRLKELGISESIFQVYDVLAIVGTADPCISELPYISLEDIISGTGEEKIRNVFVPFVSEEKFIEINNNIVRNCSLERVIDSITLLDSEKILMHVEDFVSRLEIRLRRRISNERKIGLYVHISCLVERLIRKVPIENYPNLDEFEKCQKEMIEIIKNSFSVIEQLYNVKINTAEIGYIFDYISVNTEYSKDF